MTGLQDLKDSQDKLVVFTNCLNDQLYRKASGAAFFGIADSVLNIADIVDHAIEGCVGVPADVNSGIELSDLRVESLAD